MRLKGEVENACSKIGNYAWLNCLLTECLHERLQWKARIPKIVEGADL